ncbi:MAG: hypothetical protein AB1531_08880 [Chloroflexota bacterium]
MKRRSKVQFAAVLTILLVASLACGVGTTGDSSTPLVVVVTATNPPADGMGTVTETSTPTPTTHDVVVVPTSTPPGPTLTIESGGGGAQTAPADSDIVASLNIKNDNQTFNGVISYPDGDTYDRIFINVTGFDSVTTSGNVTLTAVCTGTGVGNVKVTSVGNTTSGTPACNSTWVNFSGNDSNQITVRFYLDSGGDAYVNWTLVVSANN